MKTARVMITIAGYLGASLATASSKVDSLKHLLETHNAIDKAEILWNIAYELFDIDNPQALFYAERAYHEVWSRGDSLQIVKVGTTYGQLLRRVGKLDRSIEVSMDLLPIARRHDYRKYTKILLNSLVAANVFKEAYDIALEFGYESLNLRKADGDSSQIANAIQSLSFIFYRLADYSQSIQYAKEALQFADYPRDVDVYVASNLNIGSSLFDCGRYLEAKSYLYRAVDLDRLTKSNAYTAKAHQMYASTLLELRQLDSAEHYATSATEIARRMDDKWTMSFSYIALSDIFLAKDDFKRSFSCIQSADSIIAAHPASILHSHLLTTKVRFYLRTGDLAKATQYFENSNIVRNSRIQSVANSGIRRAHTSYSERENIVRIQNQANLMALQLESLTRHRQLTVIIIGLLVVALILGGLLFRSYRRVSYINGLLDVKVIERTQELTAQRDSLQHYIDLNEVLRTRTANSLMSKLSTMIGLVRLARIDATRTAAHTQQAEIIASEIGAIIYQMKRGGSSQVVEP